MKKLNKKGYMLVEIIVASVIAFSIAYYLLNLTYKFKDKNEDVYYSTTMLSDKINITKNIMNDLEGKKVTNSASSTESNNNYIILDLDDGTKRKLLIDKNNKTITYGTIDASNNFNTASSSYYTKKLATYLEVGELKIEIVEQCIMVKIPISNIYSHNTYDIRLFL